MEHISGLDQLIGIMQYIGKNRGTITIPCDTPTLQEAIFKICKKDEFKEIFSEYQFQNCGYYHYSEELYGDFLNLERLGCLSAVNPLFICYMIQKSIVANFYDSIKTRKNRYAEFSNLFKKFADLLYAEWNISVNE